MANEHDNQNMSNRGTPTATSGEQIDWGSEGIDTQQAGAGQPAVSDTGGDWGSSGEPEMNNANSSADIETTADEGTEDNTQTGGSWGERTTGWYGVDKTRVIAAAGEDWGSQGIDADEDDIAADWGSQGIDADEDLDSTDTLNHIPHH